jgi:hypothetical protein
MTDNELIQLIEDVLDGAATPEQEARLQARLADDPAARRRYLERVALFEALGTKSEWVEPPADLAAGVLGEIRKGPNPAPGASGAFMSWRDAFRRRPILTWSFAIASSAALIALAIAIGIGPAPWSSRGSLPVTGTMAPPDAGGSWLQADRAVLTAGGAQATLTVFTQRGGLMVGVETRAPSRAELELRYDPAAVSVARIEGPQGAGQIRATSGILKLSLNGDESRWIHLAGADPPGCTLHVTLRFGGASRKGVLQLR